MKQALMIQGNVSLSLDLVSFPLILAYSSKESCLDLGEVEDFSAMVLIV